MSIRIGIIGAGVMGSLHAEVFGSMVDVRVKAISDIDLEKAKQLGKSLDLDVEFYRDYEEMIDQSDLDAVAIAIPDHLHKQPVMTALKADLHVLVEKPLATTLADCDEMLKQVEKSGRILMVNYTHRRAVPYAAAKESILKNNMGMPVMAYAKKNDTINIVNEKFPWLAKSTPSAFLSSHDIDLVRWFFASEAISVYAHGYKKVLKRQGFDTYDAIQAMVEFDNGAFATFESAWIYPNTFPTPTDSYIEIVLEKGVIHLDRKKEIIEVADDAQYAYPKLSMNTRIDGKLQGAFRWTLDHFIDCIMTGKQPDVSGFDAYKTAQIVEAIHQSLETGKKMFIHH